MAETYEIGMVGLGVMGRNLVMNIADHGYGVAGYDKDAGQVQAMQAEAAGRPIRGTAGLAEFVQLLRRPRTVMMLVPAGPPVDEVIQQLLPLLEQDDLIIDAGNSYFKDTNLRAAMLATKGMHYLGVGISGGAYGARHGPSIMPGGPQAAYERVRPILESVAASVDGQPCAAYLGPGSAGHYVKMVHNGIEYGLMQLIAESYDLLRRGLGLSDDALHTVYSRWNLTALNSYLLEITADIFLHVDEKTGKRLIDVILDEAKQKGTGRWASEEAMELQVPAPAIDMAVAMRHLSGLGEERSAASSLLQGPTNTFSGEHGVLLEQLQGALYVGMLSTFAQGMALLRRGSTAHGYNLDLGTVARIWRGGCIVRAALLDDIYAAYERSPSLPNPLLDARLGEHVNARQADLRAVVSTAIALGLPVPGLSGALTYLDAYRSAWLPANLIQAQRDYFGAHTYERVDAKGVFHTRWIEG